MASSCYDYRYAPGKRVVVKTTSRVVYVIAHDQSGWVLVADPTTASYVWYPLNDLEPLESSAKKKRGGV